MAHKSFFDFLPGEITEKIFLQVQCTESIIRCTAVCKSWCCSIKSSEFINIHLSRPNNTKYLLCRTLFNHYSLHSDIAPSEKCCTLVFPHSLHRIRIHGCNAGVICYTLMPDKIVRDSVGDICLWNPTVRKLRTLPRSRDTTSCGRAIGFWFDKEVNDYVVVKIAYTRNSSSVDVYSLNNNSWKTISDTCPGARYTIRDANLVYAKGSLHWMALHEPGWRIVSLDMNNAKFRETLIRECCLPKEILYLRGVDANYSYCILGRHDLGFPHDLGWPQYDNLRFVGFRNNGEALFELPPWSLDKVEIVSYDFGTKQMKNFGFFDHRLVNAYPFVKSLVLLNHSEVPVQTTLASSIDGGFGFAGEDQRVGMENIKKKRIEFLKSLAGKIFKCKSCFKVDL